MRNLDDVTAVNLAKSVRKDEADSARRSPPRQSKGRREKRRFQDCTGSACVTTFEIHGRVGGATTSTRQPPRPPPYRLEPRPRSPTQRCSGTGCRSLVGRRRYDTVTRRDTYIVTGSPCSAP